MLWARDAQSTKGAEREVLYALILRCSSQKKYSCFPSYQQLAEDTGLNIKTVKRAAKKLEDAGIIKRLVRRNRSNIFQVQVGVLQKQAFERLAAKKAEKEALVKELDDLTGLTEQELIEAEAGTPVEDDVDYSDVFTSRSTL